MDLKSYIIKSSIIFLLNSHIKSKGNLNKLKNRKKGLTTSDSEPEEVDLQRKRIKSFAYLKVIDKM